MIHTAQLDGHNKSSNKRSHDTMPACQVIRNSASRIRNMKPEPCEWLELEPDRSLSCFKCALNVLVPMHLDTT